MSTYHVLRPAWGRLTLAVLAGAGAAGSAVALAAISAWLISRAALHPPVLHLMVAIVAVRACGLSRGVLRYLERLIGHDAAFRILAGVRVGLYRRLEVLAPAGLADFRRADLAQRLAADVDAVLDLVTRVLLPYAVAAVVGLASVLMIGALVPVAGLTLAAALLVTGVLVPLLQRAAARRADGRLAPLRAELATGVVDLVHGMPDLLAYEAIENRRERLADLDARLTSASRRSAATAGVGAAVTALGTGVSVLAGLLAGAAAVRAGSLPGELLALVVLTPLAVFEIAGPLPAAAQRYATARTSLRRLAEIWSVPDPLRSRTTRKGKDATVPTATADPLDWPAEIHAAGSTASIGTRVPHLRLAGVTAAWTADRLAVTELDLDLPPGARVALVGPSGSGKSTIAALLVRFLDPRTGRITLDGTDLRDIPAARVREIVGYLPEDAYLFDTTIGANLRIARPGATDADLLGALAGARLRDWVGTLPDGLETLVGEHGLALSGGQRRRLALARLLLTGARVLILDEPGEHLDDATAGALVRDLLQAAGERTVLLITHRTADLAGLSVHAL
ncbi:ABC transporter ATP-binding protein [Actinoplanes awajinensis subsp. mycoplanecinus]|uniref:ABC transporter ATP-binding protein n=1 Tax=Actinoplanes awajinensis subsp. mycoplanecinus TaxID=135947 RepID=A0A124G742_9ACTN|nr:ABC transporter ATP-binding protein [Actinoplanes awajinensis subsp. mycoplanecinus]